MLFTHRRHVVGSSIRLSAKPSSQFAFSPISRKRIFFPISVADEAFFFLARVLVSPCRFSAGPAASPFLY